MEITRGLPLLGGLSAAAFMRRHWQRRPLLVRAAMPDVQAPVSRPGLFALASDADVESRLVVRQGAAWRVRQGPLPRSALPPLRQRQWTLLVQGLDLHVEAAHRLLARFRFVPDARLDDVMMSWASDGGGVGPHLDSYDVFLLQVQGRRRWRIGPVADSSWQAGAPLKILQNFHPTDEWLLEPGDLLYLPPRWGHDGIAEGECMTCSIGFRAPLRRQLGSEILQRLGDDGEPGADELPYRDAGEAATANPGAIPPRLQTFARRAAEQFLREPRALERALGEVLTEPKPRVWFSAQRAAVDAIRGIVLDRRTRMLYDESHIFINGESFRARGRDARLMRQLADERRLDGRAYLALSASARDMLAQWVGSGWLHGGET